MVESSTEQVDCNNLCLFGKYLWWYMHACTVYDYEHITLVAIFACCNMHIVPCTI